MTEPNPESKTDPINFVTDEKKMDQGGGGSGFGARPKKRNAQAQAKKHAKGNKKAKTTQAIQPSNESVFGEKKMDQEGGGFAFGAKSKKQNAQTQAKEHAKKEKKEKKVEPNEPSNESVFREIFGPETIRKDWSLVQGIVANIMRQKKDICWAIVLARLMQAICNLEDPNLQSEFSFLELVDQLKHDETTKFSLANLKIAFRHITNKGMLKKPLRESQEKASSQGMRIKKTFGLYEDVNAEFIRQKLDSYPVGLNLEATVAFQTLGEKKIYHLPKKRVFTPSDSERPFHTILLIGYGVTAQGEQYFIGQNSWGKTWGCRGYCRIIINEKCDIISLKE